MPSGVIYSLLSVVTMVLSMTGNSKLAAFLHDPNTVQNIMALVSAGFALAGGVAQGVAKPAVVPKIDPNGYPGWKWDNVNGWVPDPAYKPKV
jgi:hypothetical protein